MARLLIEVADPLARANGAEDLPQLLLGSYVRVDIEGRALPRAALVERSLLQDGDHVWIMDDDNRLDIRPIEVAFRSLDYVLATGGIEAGERLVTSTLPSPVHGMALRLIEATQPGKGEDRQER